MRTVDRLSDLQRGRPAVLTIGAFDGVHLGHQWLIQSVIERARMIEAISVVVTFDPRPQVALQPGALQLTDGPSKARFIEALCPDVLVSLKFDTELAGQPADAFLATILEHVNLREIWVGADFAFGHERTGNVAYLQLQGQHAGFTVNVVSRQERGGRPVSSSLIRRLVSDGRVSSAANYLGHYPGFAGPVVTGFGRGSGLGYPTANVEPPRAQQLPATGIYAGFLGFKGEHLPAAISVGYNPVFQGTSLVVEGHVLDWDGDLTNTIVWLEFVERLRDELNFPSVDDLVVQMDRDVDEARAILVTRLD